MKKKRFKKMIILAIFFIAIMNVSYAKFVSKIKGEGKVEVKIPILILENDNIISGEISKNNNIYQSDFSLKNYFESAEKISEINFEYAIEIIASTTQFPVQYQLINTDTNEEILLDENLKTDPIFIGTEKEKHNYRVIVTWQEALSLEEIEEILEVRVKIQATQLEMEVV